MKTDYTDIIMVLDRSGSMSNVKDDTIGGVNRFIEDQKAVPGEAKFTLVQFDDKYELVNNAIPIEQAKLLTGETFVPRGNTALFGAIGRAMTDAGNRFKSMSESERPAKVVMVIVTDGQENHSRLEEWSKPWADIDKLRRQIEIQQNDYKWQVVFIGANQDAVLNAKAMGISGANVLNYTANDKGTHRVYAAASSNLRAFRGGQTVSMAWSVDQQKEQDEAKD